MPVHLAVEMKNKMLEKLKKPTKKTGGLTRRKSAYGRFQDLYIRVHENVSILYADIVNFTPLSARCSAGELVSLLNELFGRFDKLAQDHDCTRIKFLGDCYYCVSGLPVARPKHAKNCVQMGLGMLVVIQEFRAATGSDIDMRIGIHTGVVLSGVIGLKKWQYDVWSDDVVIANCLESCGVPGMIHISKATLLELDNTYQVTDANSRRDSTLITKNIDTFLIQNTKSDSNDKDKSDSNKSHGKFTHPLQLFVTPINIASFLTLCGEPKPFSSTPEAKNAENIVMSSIGQMEASIQLFKKPLMIFPNCCTRVDNLNWIAVNTTSFKREIECWQEPDKYFARGALLICAVNVFLCIITFLILEQSATSHVLLGVLIAIQCVTFIFVTVAIYLEDTRLLKIHKMKCSMRVILNLPYRLVIVCILTIVLFLLSVLLVVTLQSDTREIVDAASTLVSSASDISNSIQDSNDMINQHLIPNRTSLLQDAISDTNGRNTTTPKITVIKFLLSDLIFLIGMFSSVLFLQITYVIKFPTVIILSAAHLGVVFSFRDSMGTSQYVVVETILATLLFDVLILVVLRRVSVLIKQRLPLDGKLAPYFRGAASYF